MKLIHIEVYEECELTAKLQTACCPPDNSLAYVKIYIILESQQQKEKQ